jgi:hypothetical protein
MAEENSGADRSDQIEDTEREVPQSRDNPPSTPVSNPPVGMDRKQDEGEPEPE